MTKNKELGEVNYENQEERSKDDCHDCGAQKQILKHCDDDIKSETEVLIIIHTHTRGKGVVEGGR